MLEEEMNISGNANVVIGAAAFGDHAIANSNAPINVFSAPGLSAELRQLQDALRASAKTPEQVGAVDALGEAAQALDSAKPNSAHVQEWLAKLKSAGGWVLDAAKQIGVPLAIAAIKAAVGLV